jgi:hypothetical protein
MKRVLGPCLAGLALLCVGVGLTAACQSNDSSMFVQNVLFPTPVAAGQACTFTTDPSQTTLPTGVIDASLRALYTAYYLVGNQLVSQSNSQQLKTETSIINVEGAKVRVTDAAGNQLDNYSSLTSGTIYPSTGTTPGYGTFNITAASDIAVDAIVNANKNLLFTQCGTTTLVSYATFYGHTLGGTYIESNEFEFPITVCATSAACGTCLVGFDLSERGSCTNATTLQPMTLKTPNCQAPSATASSLPVPCVLGQDTAIDCSQCQNETPCLGAYASGPPNCASSNGDD